MAQNPKTLEIVAARMVGPETRVLTVAEVGGSGFHDIGGKYVIWHTGLVLGDKAVKRAYSLMPSEAGHAEIAVKLIGPGARLLHAAEPSSRFTFSGPWGKLLPETGLAERTLLVATDTGITSALGVVEQAAERERASTLTVLWLTAPSETFLAAAHVKERVERSGARLFTAELPEVNATGRLDVALRHATAVALEHEATHLVATGDGAVVHPLKTLLPAAVPHLGDARCECFFNNPEKKSA